jgi:hypothetical protein
MKFFVALLREIYLFKKVVKSLLLLFLFKWDYIDSNSHHYPDLVLSFGVNG